SPSVISSPTNISPLMPPRRAGAGGTLVPIRRTIVTTSCHPAKMAALSLVASGPVAHSLFVDKCPVGGRPGEARVRSTDVTTAPGAFANLAALRACWHPVAFGHDLADRPVHADLLGEPLVLWRGPGGGPRANSDLCVHRGTALSLGWITGDELVCPYH